MSPTPLIQVRGLERVYGEGDALVHALAGVDLDIYRGEFVALMGPSGSGKSTLLNTLGCLDMPTAGTFHFRGVEVTGLARGERARLRRAFLGFVFQGFHLLSRSTALENVALPLLYRGIGKTERERRAAETLREVGMLDRAHHLPSQLSGGQQQRVAIARALVIEPELMLADEPTGNLDTTMSHEIMQLLGRLNKERGITIVMVTHEPEMTEYTSRVVHFKDGLVERQGPQENS